VSLWLNLSDVPIPSSTVVLKKASDVQIGKNYKAYYGTRNFIACSQMPVLNHMNAIHTLRTSFFKIQFNNKTQRSRDSAVSIAIGYGLGHRGVGIRVLVGSRIFFTSSRPALGPTQPPIQSVPAVLSPGRGAYHSPPASAEVKKMWIYTSTPPYAFMA
jgi:hypothetical protein